MGLVSGDINIKYSILRVEPKMLIINYNYSELLIFSVNLRINKDPEGGMLQ